MTQASDNLSREVTELTAEAVAVKSELTKLRAEVAKQVAAVADLTAQLRTGDVPMMQAAADALDAIQKDLEAARASAVVTPAVVVVQPV